MASWVREASPDGIGGKRLRALERSRFNWGDTEKRPVPKCPNRPIFTSMEPKAIAKLSAKEREATNEERVENSGCSIIASWEATRHLAIRDRAAFCRSCAIRTGAYPPSTPLYELARKHLALLHVELAPGRDYYTERQREAILVVWAERELCKSERMKDDK